MHVALVIVSPGIEARKSNGQRGHALVGTYIK